MTNHLKDIRSQVLARIAEEKVSMRPRWQFVVHAALVALGAVLLVLTLIYLASLVVFFLRESGLWFAPVFGVRGWFDMLRSLPPILILLVVACSLILEYLVRLSTFGYRRPVMVTLGGIVLLVIIGGVAVGFTPFHHQLERLGAPPDESLEHAPLGFWYHGALRPPPPGDVFRGVVVIHDGDRIVIQSAEVGTTTLLIDKKTRLPYGEDFAPGDMVLAIGDETASGTVHAFGIRTVDDPGR